MVRHCFEQKHLGREWTRDLERTYFVVDLLDDFLFALSGLLGSLALLFDGRNWEITRKIPAS